MAATGIKGQFGSEIRGMIKLGLPVIAAQLLMMSMSFVDTVMSGNYAAEDLAAVAVGFSLFTPLLTLGSGILMAVSPIVSQAYGARRLDIIGSNVRQAIWLSILLSIPCILILRNLYPVMMVMGIEPEVRVIASGYLKAISWGALPTFLFLVMRYFNEGLGNTRPAMYFAIIGLFFNIFGNYTLIYGHFGFPELGGVGSGWATTIVVWVMFLCMLLYTLTVKSFQRFRIFALKKGPSRRLMYELLKLGFPIGLSGAMEVSMFAVTALLMASMGTLAVAGHQIALNFAALTFMIPFGLSTAITVRVGKNIGRGSLNDARYSGFVGILLCTVIMAFTAMFILLFAPQIAGIYTDDTDVINVAVTLLYMAAVFQISDGLQVSGYGALRGMKDTKIPMYVNLLAYWIIGLPTGYILGFAVEMGPVGMWIGLIAGLTTAAILHNIRFYKLTYSGKDK